MGKLYIIRELQNENSQRAGYKFTGTLSQAKRKASVGQCFHGTVLKIENDVGETVAIKKGNRWN